MTDSISKKALSTLLVAGALAFSCPATAGLFTYSAFDVDFTIDATNGDNSFTLRIENAADTTDPEWDNANYLGALGFKDLGIDFQQAGVSASLTSTPDDNGWDYIQSELNGQGCSDPNGQTGVICFASAPPIGVTNDMSFLISFTNAILDIDELLGPHLKLQFLSGLDQTCRRNAPDDCYYSEKEGSLLSVNIPGTPVPEPGSLALMLTGFGLLGIATRSRRRKGKTA